jgi:hypothetical protein
MILGYLRLCFPECSGNLLVTRIRLILVALIKIADQVARMPVCTNNVKKRKARRIKNDRLQAAKKAAKAKV